MCDYVGRHRFVSRVSGDEYEVKVRKQVVDARYLEPAVPASTRPPFEVAPEARCVPVNDLSRVTGPADGYVIIGAGKTAVDACLWLLEVGVSPSDIRWIKPREAWLQNRVFAQGGELVGTLFEGISLQLEAAAQATSLDDLFERLERGRAAAPRRRGRLAHHVQGPHRERGRARAAPAHRRRGAAGTDPAHRARRDRAGPGHGPHQPAPPARALCGSRAEPGTQPSRSSRADRITLQPIRTGLIPFNAALVGFVEATRHDVAEQNRLCPPNRLPDVPLDWVRGTLVGMTADNLWSKDAAVSDWLERARLNPARGLRRRGDEPRVQQARKRYVENVRPGLERLQQLLAAGQRRAGA